MEELDFDKLHVVSGAVYDISEPAMSEREVNRESPVDVAELIDSPIIVC